MEQGQESERGDFVKPFLGFVLHQFIATVGALLLGTVVVFLLAALVAVFTRTPSEGLLERVTEPPLFKLGADNPYFVGPILMAFVLGWTSRRYLDSRAAAWVWVLPALALVWNLMTWKSYSPLGHWADVEANFFTTNCGDSDCLYELFVTAPFYTSIAYSLGRLATTLRIAR
jgi:hypothetical protein